MWHCVRGEKPSELRAPDESDLGDAPLCAPGTTSVGLLRGFGSQGEAEKPPLCRACLGGRAGAGEEVGSVYLGRIIASAEAGEGRREGRWVSEVLGIGD